MPGRYPEVAYPKPPSCREISRIVSRFSTNHEDVRRVLTAGLDLSRCTRVLDLGCGWGFGTEGLAKDLPEEAVVFGVDADAENREPFLETLSRHGLKGEFVKMKVFMDLPWDDDSFDLVIATYSLYFFASSIGHIARVLSPDGFLLATTHMKASAESLGRLLGDEGVAKGAEATIERFCGENAYTKLKKSFEHIEILQYPNELVFGPEDEDDLVKYIAYRLERVPSSTSDLWPLGRIRRVVREAFRRHGAVRLNKDDICIRAGGPRVPENGIPW